MFFVSTVPAPAVCLSALCSSVLPEPVLSVFVPMHAACVRVCVCVWGGGVLGPEGMRKMREAAKG